MCEWFNATMDFISQFADKDTFYWFFSTVAQSSVALVAFVGVIYIFKGQRLQSKLEALRNALFSRLISSVTDKISQGSAGWPSASEYRDDILTLKDQFDVDRMLREEKILIQDLNRVRDKAPTTSNCIAGPIPLLEQMKSINQSSRRLGKVFLAVVISGLFVFLVSCSAILYSSKQKPAIVSLIIVILSLLIMIIFLVMFFINIREVPLPPMTERTNGVRVNP